MQSGGFEKRKKRWAITAMQKDLQNLMLLRGGDSARGRQPDGDSCWRSDEEAAQIGPAIV
jgi:hypothetical protein